MRQFTWLEAEASERYCICLSGGTYYLYLTAGARFILERLLDALAREFPDYEEVLISADACDEIAPPEEQIAACFVHIIRDEDTLREPFASYRAAPPGRGNLHLWVTRAEAAEAVSLLRDFEALEETPGADGGRLFGILTLRPLTTG